MEEKNNTEDRDEIVSTENTNAPKPSEMSDITAAASDDEKVQPPESNGNSIHRSRRFGKKPIALMAALLILVVGAAVYWKMHKSASTSQAKNTKVYHVGILNALDFFSQSTDGFKQKMTELGYIEGTNIIYDVEKAAAPSGNQAIIKKFVDAKVDLIFAYPTEASLEAKEGTKGTQIPVISGNAIVEGVGLVDTVQHPGGNVTGVRFPGPEIAVKRFELLHQIAPKVKRMWVPYLKDYPSVAPAFEVLDPAAKAAGVTLVKAPFTSPDELMAYLGARPANGDQGYDAILFVPEPLSVIPDAVNAMYSYADSHKLPVAGGFLLDSDSGSILNVIPNSLEVGKLAAPLADKIFKGTPAGEIPVVSPENELFINYKAILKLNLTIDDGLLSIAKKVVR